MMQMVRKNIKPILLILLVAFVVSVFYGLGQYRSSSNTAQNPNNYIAEVNGTRITYQEWQSAFVNYISRFDNQMLSSLSDEMLALLKNNITGNLVNTELLHQYAESQKIDIARSDIDNEVASIRSSFSSDNDFNEALRQNNLTLNQLKDDIKKQLQIGKVIEAEYSNVNVTEDEITQYYDDNKSSYYEQEKRKIRHILVENEDEANVILNQLKDGIGDFENLARTKSICPSSEQGGDLGYISRGQMVKEFEDVAFSLQINEISEVVKTEYGYHIIKCEDIQEEHQRSLEEVRSFIETALRAQKEQNQYETLLASLREQADIKVNYDFTSELETIAENETQESEESISDDIVDEYNEKIIPETEVDDLEQESGENTTSISE